MNDEIFEKLKIFTVKESFVTDTLLTRSTRIEIDLGITGDDAIEFILAFGKEFCVDVSEFRVSDYFKGEGWSFSEFFCKREKGKFKDLTLGDLENAIKLKKLI